jgi:hypothetical protein
MLLYDDDATRKKSKTDEATLRGAEMDPLQGSADERRVVYGSKPRALVQCYE